MKKIKMTATQFYKHQANKEHRLKTMKYNIKTYPKEIKELKFLVDSKRADNFTADMYKALILGRKITPKMLESIHKIIKRNSPEELEKKRLETQRLLGKTNIVRLELSKCNYHHIYEARSEEFLNSLEEQIRRWGNLSPKQKLALNNMYKRFLKKNEKKA
jgi:hypothetical protein